MVATGTPLTIPGPGGTPLAGRLHLPPDRSLRRAVVVAHGMLSSKTSAKHTAICDALASAGVAALRFDFRGRGDSPGRLADLTVSGEVDDLRAAAGRLRELGAEQLAAVGSSLGGTVAILLAAADGGLAALATAAAPARLPRAPRTTWDDTGEQVSPAFFADAATHDVLAAAARVACPWLVLHGAADPVVPVEDARELAAAGTTTRLEIHPDAGHRFAEPDEQAWLVERIREFVAAAHRR